MVVLGGPDRLLRLQRAREPGAVRVDLRRVCLQRLVPDREVVAAGYPGGDLKLLAVLGALIPGLEPVGVRRLEPAPQQLLVQRLVARAVEAGEVVQLQRLPRLARSGIPVGVRGGLERLDTDVVALDMVRVRV